MRLTKIIIGFGLLTGGIAMLALPGPGWLTIASGLALLASNFRGHGGRSIVWNRWQSVVATD